MFEINIWSATFNFHKKAQLHDLFHNLTNIVTRKILQIINCTRKVKSYQRILDSIAKESASHRAKDRRNVLRGRNHLKKYFVGICYPFRYF